MIFGKEKNKGLVLDGLSLKVVTIGEEGVKKEDILIHDAKCENDVMHHMLTKLNYPLVTGIIRSVEEPTLEEREAELTEQVKSNSNFSKVDDLFFSGETYEVK